MTRIYQQLGTRASTPVCFHQSIYNSRGTSPNIVATVVASVYERLRLRVFGVLPTLLLQHGVHILSSSAGPRVARVSLVSIHTLGGNAPIFDHGSRTRFLLGDAAFDLVDLPFHHQLPDRFASPSHLPLLPPLAQSAGAIEEVEAVDAVKTGAGKAEMVAAICICMEETFTEAFTKKKALSAAFVAAPDAYLGSPLQQNMNRKIAEL
ncbi:hypothetical protein B0H13DRAFT_2313296 [Mycena leptocephala]|nr:hypothetical protein B0H13DRAFT_2313296 [Mycena leptocephala]